MKRFAAIDLFAGAGGMSLGAQLAGIDVVLAVEADPYAAKTYAANHANTTVFNDDVRRLNRLAVPSCGYLDRKLL